MMKPILVRAFGRTGTTLLMQLLGTSKETLVPNGYPYESRYLTYFCRMSNLMDDNYPDKTFKDGNVLDFSHNTLGNCPYNFNDITNGDNLRERLFQGLWNQFSISVNESSDENYIYYAEKVALELAPRINSYLPNVKNIFLVRDPRGELASIMSFNNKRGFNGFGWLDDDTEETFGQRMIETRIQYFNTLLSFGENNKNIIVLRFEDIVSDLKQTSEKLSKFLGVELDFKMVEDNTKNMSHHMTSKSIIESRDKWKSELKPSTIEMFSREMEQQLKGFGYV